MAIELNRQIRRAGASPLPGRVLGWVVAPV